MPERKTVDTVLASVTLQRQRIALGDQPIYFFSFLSFRPGSVRKFGVEQMA